MALTTAKPTNTTIIWEDQTEHLRYKEQRRFMCWKDKGHYYFDKIWKAGIMTREEAYQWLTERLGLQDRQAHFSSMNIELIRKSIYYSQQLLNDNRRLDKDFGSTPITPYYQLEE